MSPRIDTSYDSNRHTLSLNIVQGPLHLVHSLFIFENDVACDPRITLTPFPFPAQTDLINKCLHQIEESYINNGFPFAIVKLKSFELIPNTTQVHLTIDVTTGEKLFFGKISFVQQQHSSIRFLESHLTFKKDDLYSAQQVTETCENLEKTGLFEEVHAELGQPDHLTHSIPILIRVPEAPLRSIGMGLSLSTQDGLGCLFDWSHENLWGEHEKAYLSTNLNFSEQELHISYLNPFRRMQDLAFILTTSIKRGLHYKALEYSGSLSCNLLLGKRSLQKIGIKLEKFYDIFVGTSFLFSSLFEGSYPYFDRNGPSLSGCRFWWRSESFFSFYSIQDYFLKIQGGLAMNLPLPKGYRLGFHLQMHSILGGKEDQIPLVLRCFGGSSYILRGYAYRTVSPFNADHFPFGGMSLLASSLEARIPLSKDLDFVPFLDIGQTYLHSLPDLNQPFLYSVGIGLRKKIAIGSIRADIGFPLKKRPNFDNPMELYVLLGENF